MHFRSPNPRKQIAHQLRNTTGRWGNMHTMLTIEYSDTTLPVSSVLLHQLSHHQLVCPQQILLSKGVQLQQQIVSINGILHLFHLIRCTQHTFTLNNGCHLIQRKRIILNGKRRMDSLNPVLFPQLRGRQMSSTCRQMSYRLSNIRNKCCYLISNNKWRYIYTIVSLAHSN